MIIFLASLSARWEGRSSYKVGRAVLVLGGNRGGGLPNHNTSMDLGGDRQEYMQVSEDQDFLEEAAISLRPEHLASQAGAQSACHGLHRRQYIGRYLVVNHIFLGQKS